VTLLSTLFVIMKNESAAYWVVNDPTNPTSHLSSAPAPSNRSNFRMIAPTARRPQEFVEIHRNADIAWASGPSPVVQHVPPTNHRHYSDSGISSLQDMNNSNHMVSSSTASDSDLSEIPPEPVNFRDDIGLDDKALVTISTKELNRLLKKKGINKARQKEIKSERRTLKNRGYASNCRVSREEEEKTLEKEIFDLESEIKRHEPLEKLEDEYMQLRSEINCLKKEMNITDDSDDSDFNSEIPKLEDIKDDVKSEPDDNDDDDYTSSDDDDGSKHSQYYKDEIKSDE